MATAIHLPFRVKPRVVIDATFATRDLVFTLNRSPRYRVLVLTEKPTRLFDATTNVLTEFTDKPFPMVHKGPGGASRLPGGQGINRSAVRDESHRQFFRKVDDALAAIQKEDHLPSSSWASIATSRSTRRSPRIPTRSSGSWPAAMTTRIPANLGKLVWPVFKAGCDAERTRALVRLNEAVSVNRHASGIDQVWRAAFDKRCQTLLVETGLRTSRRPRPPGDRLLPYSGRGAAALDDAVDEVIENVLADGGEVFFYDPGVLDLHQRDRGGPPLLSGGRAARLRRRSVRDRSCLAPNLALRAALNTATDPG